MRRPWGLLVVLALLVGCDAAKEHYERGEAARGDDEIEAAIAHYEKGVAADPDTEFGGKAKEALASLMENQGSPRETIESLINVTAAKKPELVDKLFDPAFMRMDARGLVCLKELVKDTQCTGMMLDCLQRKYAGCNEDPECPVDVEACTCGARGTKAADAAGQFSQSSTYERFTSLNVSAESCRVLDTKDLTRREVSLIPDLSETGCGEVAVDDNIKAVKFRCGKAPLTFFLGKKDGKWSIIKIHHITTLTTLSPLKSD